MFTLGLFTMRRTGPVDSIFVDFHSAADCPGIYL